VGEAYETKRDPEERSPNCPRRLTYLIDPEGRIARAYRVKDIPAHPEQVLKDLRELQAVAVEER
jgi:peroxiredoxin